MLIVSTSKAGNIVTVDITFDEEGTMLEFESKKTVIYESIEKDITFVDAMNKIKSVLADEKSNL